ncbi:MAG: alpha/beta fold hydrolase [Tepidiformaceae bacterium]
MPSTQSHGWTIHYETHGQPANPAIVMVLGLSHRLAHWGRLPHLLSDELFVITFDCRGMGESERRDEPFTVRDEAEDVLAVLDALGCHQPVVYGRSRGGMIAQEFALAYPDRTRALILTATSHRGPGSVGWNEAVTRAMNFTPDMTREQIFATQAEAMAAPGWKERDPKAYAFAIATDLEAPPKRFAVVRQQEAIADWQSLDRLPSLHVPALVICGEEDGMTPAENSHQLASLIPAAELRLIPQCGHNPMLEKPAEEARLILDFVATTGPRAPR